MAKIDSKKQEKAFATLLKKVKAGHGGEEPDALEPIAELVFSFLTWNATVKQADTAFGKIMAQVVDLNELRVSHVHEIVELIGVRYPDAQRRVIRLLESMMEIYDREHDFKMSSVLSKGKREQREYLDTLPGIPPFVAARVGLLSFGAHAMPVDDRLMVLLIDAGVFDDQTTPVEAESWLTRQVKAGEALDAYMALQAWADKQRVTLPQPEQTPPMKTAAAAPPAEEEPDVSKSSSKTKAPTKKTSAATTKKKPSKKKAAATPKKKASKTTKASATAKKKTSKKRVAKKK